MPAIGWRDQRRARNLSGDFTDRGPEGCNIVTAWALVSAPAADPAPPFGPRHPDPYRESGHRPLRHLPVAGRRSTIALGGAAIVDYPDERAAGRGQANG
jgi:hypothetical protein